MKRGLRIEAYRNMGFKDGKPCATELILNEDAEKGNLGGVLTLIGENNAGKSNVLDALEIFGEAESLRIENNNFYERIIPIQTEDISDLYVSADCKNPRLSLFAGSNSYTKSYTASDENKNRYTLITGNSKVDFTAYGSFCDNPYNSELAIPYFMEQTGIKIITPKIIRYVDELIENSALETSNDCIDTQFFTALFHTTHIKIADVEAAFNLFLKTRDKNAFEPVKVSINKGLKDVAKKFNSLYNSEKTPYSFEVDFDRQGLYLTIFHNGNGIILNKQSDGFRYFFDLFFNLLCTTELESGDIIIMDEPATNLHVKGQRELRAFLKEFAVQNDILIIIATHSPFMIDTDNLDEIRLVVSDGTVSHIENDFTAYDSGDPDSLRPIKEAFTAENHIIVNPKETVVFVAGMDAYCYLVAFKHLFEISGITFLPVKTFGDDDAEAKTVSNALDKIRSDSFILAESGEAAERMKGIVSDKTVLSLSGIDSRFSTFAALFADSDLPASASVFKNHITRGSVTVGDNTKANFRKVFDTLLHEAE